MKGEIKTFRDTIGLWFHVCMFLLVFTRYTDRYHSLSLVVSLIVIWCHSLYYLFSLVITCCNTRCNHCVTRFHLLSLVVTRFSTRLSFYQQFEIDIEESD